jgi:hypothetical protein
LTKYEVKNSKACLFSGLGQGEIDIFDDDYLNKISKIKLTNTKNLFGGGIISKVVEKTGWRRLFIF